MARGFVVNLNLSEMDRLTSDTLALNNLGGDATAQNLSLFINNTNNVSVLKPERSFGIENASVDNNGNLLYECSEDIDFRPGGRVTITGVNPAEYNLTNAKISVANEDSFIIFVDVNESFSPYVSGGIATSADYIIDQNKDGEDIVFRGTAEQLVFSNNTLLTHNTNGVPTEYLVINSDGENYFQLQDSQGNLFTPTGDLTRKDEVTFDNILNLKPDRLPTITSRLRGQSDGSDSGLIFAPELDAADLVPLEEKSTLSEILDSVYAKIDSYRLRRRITVVTNEPVNFDSVYTSDGAITVKNTQNIPLDDESSPGIFIYNGESSIRAFSDNSNPWSDTVTNSGFTVTNASVSTVRKLEATNPNFIGLSAVSESGSAVTDYTHKIPIRVNDGTGERTYFLMVKKG